MNNYTGMVVKSIAGHDKGGLFFVVKQEGDRLFLVNGKQRKFAKPKGKNQSHVVCVRETLPVRSGATTKEAPMELPHSDKELRRTLAALKEVITLGKR